MFGVIQTVGELTECKVNGECLDEDARHCLNSQSGVEGGHAVGNSCPGKMGMVAEVGARQALTSCSWCSQSMIWEAVNGDCEHELQSQAKAQASSTFPL